VSIRGRGERNGRLSVIEKERRRGEKYWCILVGSILGRKMAIPFLIRKRKGKEELLSRAKKGEEMMSTRH